MSCINLKIKTKKGRRFLYCDLLKKEITFDNCKDCANKEYKTKKIKNSFYMHNNCENNVSKNKKRTINRKNCAKIIKIKKNPKIAKLERNRKSVFTNNLTKCILCNNPKEELHEIFPGRNRQNSMKYNFVLPLCHKCHSINQENSQFNEFWHKKAQLYFEQHLGSREEFIDIFKKNYL